LNDRQNANKPIAGKSMPQQPGDERNSGNRALTQSFRETAMIATRWPENDNTFLPLKRRFCQ
jgi:hypothetical protein